jgi:GR25 family glycosyltransferase involved in LPS biosynthesis
MKIILIIICLLLITSIILIWGGLTKWKFICRKKDNYDNKISFFDKVIYINLDRRKNRKLNIETQLKKYIKDYERFPAQDGQKLNLQLLSPDFIKKEKIHEVLSDNKTFGITLTKGAIGCALSHKKIWEMVAQSNYEKVLVVEDDIKINKNIYLFQKLYDKFPKDWDIIYLGSGQYIKDKKISKNIYKLKHAYQTIGYVINNKSAKKLLKGVFPLTQQIDSSIYKVHDLNTYILEPNPIIPRRDMKSDIQIFG